ncbi:MAG: hypothetical protein E6R07_10895 [Nevskiaceae bacterium]|nr:MAG: hypothetical protein E6R07_10895 [Nevskiaceae bacterium]
MIALLVGLWLLLIIGAAVVFIRVRSRESQNDALLRIRALGGDEVAAISSLPTREQQIKNPVLRWLCHFLWRSGSEVEVATVQKIIWALLIAMPLVFLLLGWFAGAFVIGVALVVGFILLTRQASVRRAKIIEQMPTFLESAVRVLAAGNTLEESLASAARESPDPLRTLFISITRQVRLGAPIENVLMETGEIHKLADIRVMALASAVNRKYGGSLKNILRSLIQAIRSRDMAMRELRALTAETRFSAMVLAILPILLTSYILIQNRVYYANIWEDHTTRWVLIGSAILQVLGILVIWRMMKSTTDDGS